MESSPFSSLLRGGRGLFAWVSSSSVTGPVHPHSTLPCREVADAGDRI